MRSLGVDVGAVRTGLALSDPQGITCRPLEVLTERDRAVLATAITAVAEREGAEIIVVGLPRPLSGTRNAQQAEVETFVDLLTARAGRPVVTWDERFTSKLARGSRPRGQAEDSVAACHLLQGYLDRQAFTRPDGRP